MLLTAEAAKLSNDDLVTGVVEEIVTTDMVFNVLPFRPVNGRAYVFNRESTLSSGSFVDTDDIITEGAATFENVNQKLKRIVGDVHVDNFLQATMSDQQDQVGIQVAKKAKALARTYANKLINGSQTGNAKEFDGLKALVTGAQVIAPTGGNGDALAFTTLDNLLDLVKVGGQLGFIMNSRMLRSFNALVRALGGFHGEQINLPGVSGPIPAYRGVPILKNDWVGLDETVGGSTTCTSVYLVAFDENEGLAGLMASEAMGIEVILVGPHQTKDATIYRVRWYCSLALHSTLAAAKATGITN